MANSTNISEGILAGGGTDARSMTATDLNNDQFFYASIQMLKLRFALAGGGRLAIFLQVSRRRIGGQHFPTFDSH
jgi:hypothetical protein